MTKELDITKITDDLFIAASPKARHRQQLIDMNIGLIINMVLQVKEDKELTQPPLRLVRYKTIDFFLTPMPLKPFMQGTREALKTFREGKKVLVYCRKGIHRSPAMASAILIGLGYNSEDAIALVKKKRAVAKPDDWYIRRRIEAFEEKWKQTNKLNNAIRESTN